MIWTSHTKCVAIFQLQRYTFSSWIKTIYDAAWARPYIATQGYQRYIEGIIYRCGIIAIARLYPQVLPWCCCNWASSLRSNT